MKHFEVFSDLLTLVLSCHRACQKVGGKVQIVDQVGSYYILKHRKRHVFRGAICADLDIPAIQGNWEVGCVEVALWKSNTHLQYD